jgi:hypothetical protein
VGYKTVQMSIRWSGNAEVVKWLVHASTVCLVRSKVATDIPNSNLVYIVGTKISPYNRYIYTTKYLYKLRYRL